MATTQNTKDRAVTRRDSATNILKKLGVDKANYNDFIVKTEKGFFVRVQDAAISVGKAEPRVTPFSAPVKPTKKLAKTAKPKKRESVSGFMQQMIRDGSTDAEVWEASQKKFGLDDSKKHYPRWYRNYIKRQAAAAAAAK